MASPHTSNLSFIDSDGRAVPGPREWTPEVVSLPVEPDSLIRTNLFRNSYRLPLAVREIAGEPRLMAEWPRAGTGRYNLRLEVDGELVEESEWEISPAKISKESYGALI